MSAIWGMSDSEEDEELIEEELEAKMCLTSHLKDKVSKTSKIEHLRCLMANPDDSESDSDNEVIDLSRVSQELAYLASDADLVIMEGNGRGIETNLYAQFNCDSINIGLVKHPEVAQFLGGRLYDCVFKYKEVSS
ncbi:damage-control phosphatase At2g17340-like [Silene latifolia]|uniref:damage-control phosphatase At2g17340-like n=1 Tax=Silene latifolia TaxID=37657 RepID=UPI003D76D49A